MIKRKSMCTKLTYARYNKRNNNNNNNTHTHTHTYIYIYIYIYILSDDRY